MSPVTTKMLQKLNTNTDVNTSRIIFCCKSMKFAEPKPKLLSPERPPSGPRPNGVALTSADCASPGTLNYKRTVVKTSLTFFIAGNNTHHQCTTDNQPTTPVNCTGVYPHILIAVTAPFVTLTFNLSRSSKVKPMVPTS